MSRREQQQSPSRAIHPKSRPCLIQVTLIGIFLGPWAAPAYAAPVCAAPVPGAAVEKVRGFSTAGGGWLVDARNGAFYVDDRGSDRGSMVSRLDGPALGPVDRVLEINSDLSVLIKN